MPLIGINPARQRPESPSTLERIGLAVDIASKVLGTGFAVPKFFQERRLGKAELKLKEAQAAHLGEPSLEKAKQRIEIETKTRPALEGEQGAFEVPGLGRRSLREEEKMTDVDKLAYQAALGDYMSAQPGEEGANEWTFGKAKIWLKPKQGSENIDRRIKQESDLRKEYKTDERVKRFSVQADALKRLDASVSENTPEGDIGIVYAYIKMLDPDSAVREGELALAGQARGVPEEIIGTYNRLISAPGSRLPNRERFKKAAHSLFEPAKTSFEAVKKYYTNLAIRKGFDAVDVVVPVGEVSQKEPEEMTDEEIASELKKLQRPR